MKKKKLDKMFVYACFSLGAFIWLTILLWYIGKHGALGDYFGPIVGGLVITFSATLIFTIAAISRNYKPKPKKKTPVTPVNKYLVTFLTWAGLAFVFGAWPRIREQGIPEEGFFGFVAGTILAMVFIGGIAVGIHWFWDKVRGTFKADGGTKKK